MQQSSKDIQLCTLQLSHNMCNICRTCTHFMASRDIMMHTPAASGMHKDDEAILSLDRPIEASRVDIDFDGSLYWDGEAVSASQMEHNFHMLALRQDLAQFVHLRASHATSYQQVLAVLASARRAGLNNIGIVNDGLLPS